MGNDETLPSDVTPHVGWFDRFAGAASSVVSRAWFFAACVLLVLAWAPTLLFLPFDTSNFLINSSTTIITFLLVALLQNAQERENKATQHKLNAIADALADLMDAHPSRDMDRNVAELRAAVGLEKRESST